jgi:hypothetical protein
MKPPFYKYGRNGLKVIGIKFISKHMSITINTYKILNERYYKKSNIKPLTPEYQSIHYSRTSTFELR